MVFPNPVRITLHSALSKTCSLALILIIAVGCSGRGEKKVAITCAPGQTQGADGKCQAAAGSQGGASTIGGGGGGGGGEGGGLESTDPSETPEPSQTPDVDEENPNSNPTPQLKPNPNEPPLINSPQTQKPPITQGPPPGGNKPPTNTISPTPSTSPLPGATPAVQLQNDPINQVETATPLFKDAPQTTAEGAPTLALKLISSPSQGRTVRVAFSHTNGVTNTQYKYHKKSLTLTPVTAAVDGTIPVDLSTIPISVTFEWNGKKCDSGLVEADFEAKTKVATCI
jgi:hypothetical protein